MALPLGMFTLGMFIFGAIVGVVIWVIFMARKIKREWKKLGDLLVQALPAHEWIDGQGLMERLNANGAKLHASLFDLFMAKLVQNGILREQENAKTKYYCRNSDHVFWVLSELELWD